MMTAYELTEVTNPVCGKRMNVGGEGVASPSGMLSSAAANSMSVMRVVLSSDCAAIVCGLAACEPWPPASVPRSPRMEASREVRISHGDGGAKPSVNISDSVGMPRNRGSCHVSRPASEGDAWV